MQILRYQEKYNLWKAVSAYRDEGLAALPQAIQGRN